MQGLPRSSTRAIRITSWFLAVKCSPSPQRAECGMCGCSRPPEGAAHDGSVAQLTPRLRKRIKHDFPPDSARYVLSYLEGLADREYGGQGRERIQAALVLASHGRRDRFESMVRLLRIDWRDVLMAGGVGQGDWSAVLDEELGVTCE